MHLVPFAEEETYRLKIKIGWNALTEVDFGGTK